MNDVRTVYGEGAIRGAAPAELMCMMFDMLAADLRRAIEALKARDIERRTGELIHAQSVLENLQGSLNLQDGGEFAGSMDRLFFAIRMKLLEAQWKESVEILTEQLEAVETVRAAWTEAMKAVVPAHSSVPQISGAEMAFEVEGVGSEWRA